MSLPGVGPKSAEKYAKLGIENLQDLLLYFPFRYEDFKTKQVLELGGRWEGGPFWSSRDLPVFSIMVSSAIACALASSRERSRFGGEFFNQPYLGW